MDAGSQDEDMGIEGEGHGGGIGGGGQGGGNGGGGQGEGNEGGGQGGEILEDVPRPIIWGRRSHLDGQAWMCECGHTNFPSRELFVDLPAFSCSNCYAQRREDFRFSFGNLAANEECPIGEVLDHGEEDDCLVFALAKGAEITNRICEILKGSHVSVPTMHPYSLKNTYTNSRLADGIAETDIDYLEDEALQTMLELLQTVGVQDEYGQYTCRIGGVEQVEGYFEDIATELAKGYPLLVDIMTGGRFEFLKYGEVYHCPFNNRTVKEGSTVMMHTVILVGAARLGKHDYFYFLNSYGKTWCVRFHQEDENKKIGGIGKLVADDICCPPYKFLRIVQQ